MKFQSILINTNKGLTNEDLNLFLKKNLNLDEELHSRNYLEIVSLKNSIGIAELKEISEWINLKSNMLKFVIIRKAETLTPEAQNSLLKNIEEPPDNTIFVLISKNSEKILETIRSRCLLFFIKSDFKTKEEYQDIALKLLKADYLSRLKIVEQLAKDYENREELSEIVFEVIKNLKRNTSYEEKIRILKNIYIGIKSSVNLKLCLDLLAICLEN